MRQHAPLAWIVPALFAVHCQAEGEGGCASGCDDLVDDDSALDDDSAVAGDDDSSVLGDDDSGVVDDVDPTESLATCGFDLEAALAATRVQPPGAGTGNFVPASADTLANLGLALDAVARGDSTTSAALALVMGFDICRSDGAPVAVFSAAPGGVGRSILAWRPQAASDLVLTVTHAWSEPGVLPLALELFDSLGARGLIVAGSHPCASPVPSGCPGSTVLCGGDVGVYRESDMSHAVGTDFLLFQQWLADRHEDTTFVAIHRLDAAGASISDGTRFDAPADRPFRALHAAMSKALPDHTITTCNGGGGQPVETRACGDDDVTGRVLNGAADACEADALGSTGRYIHVEVGDDVIGSPDAVVGAFQAAFLGSGR